MRSQKMSKLIVNCGEEQLLSYVQINTTHLYMGGGSLLLQGWCWESVRWPYMDISHSLYLKIYVMSIVINACVLEIKQRLLNIRDPILIGIQAGPGHK
jgi:hypothetical protein